ncbi:MAG: hypothetical protein IPO92_04260 [Saprospiraceae bacterium]|nr:hypothetical protein [Saprospiraceae bacterium]
MYTNTSLKESEHKKKGFIISFILHIVIVLLLFISLTPIKPLEEIGGILIEFGEPEAGTNATEIAAEVDNNDSKPIPTTSESKTQAISEINSKDLEDVATIKASELAKTKVNTELSKSKNKTQADAKVKAEADRKAELDAKKAKEESESKAKADLENKKKKYADLLGGGKGSNNKNGNQGAENGDPNGKALDGISKGSGRVGGGLSGRGVVFEPSFKDNSQKTGKVALSICVNADGKVAKADFTQKGSTTSDSYLIDLARKTAMKYTFTKSDVQSQCGSVIIDFKVQ